MATPDPVRPAYRSVQLSNFRGFRETSVIPLAPLTFLVGPNSSGKSSLFDSLLLLAQSRLSPLGSLIPRWNGHLVDLGSYHDCVYGHKRRLRIGITVEADLPANESYVVTRPATVVSPFRLEYRLRVSKEEATGALESVNITDLQSGFAVRVSRPSKYRLVVVITAASFSQTLNLTSKHLEQSHLSTWARLIRDRLRQLESREARSKSATPEERAFRRLVSLFSYGALEGFLLGTERVSSGRGGPQRWYSIGATAREAARAAGRPALFDTVDPSIFFPADEGRSQRKAKKAAEQMRLEMAESLRRLNIADFVENVAISPYHSTIDVRDSVTHVRSNLMEVGYGASQVLPVIRACLSPSDGPLFVEQPEIHLHPKAQGEVAEMLCDASKRRQVVVETHSVHMINRARLRVARGEAASSDIVVIYVERNREGSIAHPIALDDAGDFKTAWPGGFFDERYEDTKQLLKLRHAPKQTG